MQNFSFIIVAIILHKTHTAFVNLQCQYYTNFRYDVSSAFGSDASSYSHLRLPLKYKRNWKDLSLDGSLGQNSQFFTGDGDYIFCPPNNGDYSKYSELYYDVHLLQNVNKILIFNNNTFNLLNIYFFSSFTIQANWYKKFHLQLIYYAISLRSLKI